MERKIWVAVLPTLLVVMSGAVQAQEASLTSYNDLLSRMENLEQQVQAQSHQIYSGINCDTCGSQDVCGCQQECGRYYATYESVFVTPYQSNNTAIIAQNDPVIEHLGFDWDLKQSNRIELGYLAPKGGFGWRARYWQFDQNTSLTVDSNSGLVQDEGVIAWAQTDSDIIGLVDVDTATMTQSIRVNVLDLELQAQATKNFLVSGGFRYSEIDQNYLAVTDSGIGMGDIKFRGYGPTFAGEYSRNVIGRWDVFASGRGSLLYGQQDFLATDDNSNITYKNRNTGTLAGAFELQAGVKWTSRNDRFFFKSGLEAQYWANVGSPNPSATFMDDSDVGNFDDVMNEDLGFVGFTLGGGIQY
ncbi:Lpg1974 family pore-forming outer membrane protein [Bremerella cremea]|uniref:Lpg1974 family pore-forming outer membrane protein n=1 Tax=Bremerella cremea TaxID=1031537 RepID=UPI0031EC7ECE